MQPNDAEVQDGVATYLQNSLRSQAGLERTWLVSLARLLQRLLPVWFTRWLFRYRQPSGASLDPDESRLERSAHLVLSYLTKKESNAQWSLSFL